MTTCRFTLTLAEREESETEADELYGQFDDGTLITSGGVTRIEFNREAGNLSEAIRSAIEAVERTQFRVAQVETPESYLIEEINADVSSAADTKEQL